MSSDAHSNGHAHPDDGNVHPHIASVTFYAAIFAVLIVFTILTYVIGNIHLGPANLVVAVVIATIKATLVVLYFMHLKDDARFNALLFVGALLFGGVFLTYTSNDTGTRARLDRAQGARINPATGERAPGGPPAPRPMEAATHQASEQGAAPGAAAGHAAEPAAHR